TGGDRSQGKCKGANGTTVEASRGAPGGPVVVAQQRARAARASNHQALHRRTERDRVDRRFTRVDRCPGRASIRAAIKRSLRIASEDELVVKRIHAEREQ